ncbi:MAG: hypothetical protein ABJG88_07055, partial [Litorimonas sp.]
MKKSIQLITVALVLGLAVLMALNWGNIRRLLTVNSLFNAEKIVHNFSHMDTAFLHHDLAESKD